MPSGRFFTEEVGANEHLVLDLLSFAAGNAAVGLHEKRSAGDSDYGSPVWITVYHDRYRAHELSWGSRSRTISCLNGEEHIRLDYELNDGRSAEDVFGIDEYAERKAVTVSGQEAILYLNTDEDEHSLVWADEAAGIAFYLEATEDEEIMLQVAEAVSSAK